jgi:hypothetical protein
VRAEEDRGILRIAEFSPEYLYLLASALGILPSMSRKPRSFAAQGNTKLGLLVQLEWLGERAAKLKDPEYLQRVKENAARTVRLGVDMVTMEKGTQKLVVQKEKMRLRRAR